MLSGSRCADTAVVDGSGAWVDAASELKIHTRFGNPDSFGKIMANISIVDEPGRTNIGVLHLCGSRLDGRRPLRRFVERRRECGDVDETGNDS